MAASEVFKVGLAVPVRDRLAHCVGLGAGPSEIEFREWLHKRIMFSQMPLLWAEVEPLRRQEGRDLERQLHLLIYASGCSPRRQVFWSSDGMEPGDAERFLQSVVTGELLLPGSACAVLLAGTPVMELEAKPLINGAVHRTLPEQDTVAEYARSVPPLRSLHRWHGTVMAMFAVLWKRLACLWMAW